MALKHVVFPAPLGPRRAVMLPLAAPQGDVVVGHHSAEPYRQTLHAQEHVVGNGRCTRGHCFPSGHTEGRRADSRLPPRHRLRGGPSHDLVADRVELRSEGLLEPAETLLEVCERPAIDPVLVGDHERQSGGNEHDATKTSGGHVRELIRSAVCPADAEPAQEEQHEAGEQRHATKGLTPVNRPQRSETSVHSVHRRQERRGLIGQERMVLLGGHRFSPSCHHQSQIARRTRNRTGTATKKTARAV